MEISFNDEETTALGKTFQQEVLYLSTTTKCSLTPIFKVREFSLTSCSTSNSSMCCRSYISQRKTIIVYARGGGSLELSWKILLLVSSIVVIMFLFACVHMIEFYHFQRSKEESLFILLNSFLLDAPCLIDMPSAYCSGQFPISHRLFNSIYYLLFLVKVTERKK